MGKRVVIDAARRKKGEFTMKKTDETITDALKFHADAIEASPVLKKKIDLAILEQENGAFRKERRKVTLMKWNIKKVAAAALGVCLLTGGVCYAAEQMAYYISSSAPSDYQTDFSAVDSLAKEAGLDVNAVERFANGYTFEEVGIDKTSAIGEEGQKLYDFSELSIHYGREGAPSISIFAEDAAYYEGIDEAMVYDAVRECDGIEVRCFTVTNKCVPSDDDLTDEDRANMGNPNYNYASGSSEVEIMQSMNVVWVKDGVYYHMLGFDLTLSAEEMLDMAEEMIAAK